MLNHTRNRDAVTTAALVTALAITAAAARATTYVYNFDNGQVVGSSGAGTPLISAPGTPEVPGAVPGTPAGTVGQDKWVLTSGTSAVVRTDPVVGFSGNYATSPTITGTPSLDGILTRKNDANFGYSLTGASQVVLMMDVLVGSAGAGSTQFRRSEMSLGVDLNEDGKIRPTAATSENPEIGFFFGYEIGLGWYVRPAGFGTAVTHLPQPVPGGVWRAQLVVDLTANQQNVTDAQGNPFSGANGSGSLYVKQLADANGGAVDDVFRAVDSSMLNVNLGILRMATINGGAGWAADPGNWNGMMIRTAGNGGLDNISISTDPLDTPPQWALNDVGSWTAAGNWYPSAVPNGVGATAEFGGAITAARTVVADSDVTVGTLRVNNANTYVFAGAGSLTLQANGGNAQVHVEAGTQKINLPLTIASDTTLNVAGDATLKISDPVTILAGKTVTEAGGGTVLYESSVTIQPGATLALADAGAVQALSLAGSTNNWSGTLSVGTGGLVLRTGSLADLTNQLRAGYNNGAWNGSGIVSPAARNDASHTTALGYATAASLLGLAGSATDIYNGSAVDASSLIVKYTYYGDANLDGRVNADDYVLLDRGRAKGLAGWINGDFNYDGAINAADYLLADTSFILHGPPLDPSFLAMRGAQFGGEYVSSLLAAVPEPSSAGLLAAAGVVALRRRSRVR
jgi:hypothetical protein